MGFASTEKPLPPPARRFLWLCSLILLPKLAPAQDVPRAPARSVLPSAPTDKVTAEALFQSGRELLIAKRYAEACEKLRISYELDPAVGALLYLADCYAYAGKTATAWATFREVESLAHQEGQTQRAEIARRRSELLEAKLSHLTVEVEPASQPESFTLLRDGAPLPRASWNLKVPVDPGRHTLTASAPGYRTWTQTVLIRGPAETHTVRVTPLTPSGNAPGVSRLDVKSPPSPGDPGDRLVWHSWVTGGALTLGGASLVAAGVLFWEAKDRRDDSRDHCAPSEPNRCEARGVELREEAFDLARASTLLSVTGAALIASGLTLWLVAPDPAPEPMRSDSARGRKASPAPTARIAIHPVARAVHLEATW